MLKGFSHVFSAVTHRGKLAALLKEELWSCLCLNHLNCEIGLFYQQRVWIVRLERSGEEISGNMRRVLLFHSALLSFYPEGKRGTLRYLVPQWTCCSKRNNTFAHITNCQSLAFALKL